MNPLNEWTRLIGGARGEQDLGGLLGRLRGKSPYNPYNPYFPHIPCRAPVAKTPPPRPPPRDGEGEQLVGAGLPTVPHIRPAVSRFRKRRSAVAARGTVGRP